MPFARYKAIIDDWDAFQQALQRPLPTCVWTNTLRTNTSQLQTLMQADDIALMPLNWTEMGYKLPDEVSPGLQWQYLGGLYHVQEEVAMLPVQLLDPQPDEQVLDLCAAPGNKTAQIAIAMQNQGTLIANDRNYHRLRAVRQNLDRLGLLNVSTSNFDGRKFPPTTSLFDKILVDAPCTGEGTSRKNPKIEGWENSRMGQALPNIQYQLLKTAVGLCKPGGRIVYATCTYAPEENEAVVDKILRKFGYCLRMRPAKITGFQSAVGLNKWQRQSYLPELEQAMRVWPHHNDSGGFFIAILDKERSSHNEVPSPPNQAIPLEPEMVPIEIDPTLRLELLRGRFEIPPAALKTYRYVQRNADGLHVSDASHNPPPQLKLDTLGLPFLRINLRYPKLSTPAAMLWGHLAQRNYVDLNRAQLLAYLGRQAVTLAPGQDEHCTGYGYVIIRHEGFSFGVGVYRPPKGQLKPKVESMYPKAWSPATLQTYTQAA